jgi:hypothetical protein
MSSFSTYIHCSEIGTIIILDNVSNHMSNNSEKTMPICFSQEQLKFIEDYAKTKGMLNASQAIEDILKAN